MSDVTRNLGKTLGIRERTSQMGLFTPKWMSNDLAKALHAVEKITDSQKLAEVAVNAKLQQVAGKAIERIQDESVLAGIALGDAGFFAVEKSLERVFHPDLLKQIADEAEMNWVRVAALSRLTKQNRNFDLLPYRDLIQVCVKAGNIDAVSLCTDRIILEDVYRLNRQQWLKDKKQWNVMRSFEERINQLASEHRVEIMQMRRDRNRAGLQELQDRLAAEAEKQAADFAGLTEEQMKIYSTIGGTPHLDGQYTVFGEVEEGLDVVEMIQATATGRGDRPVDDLEMRIVLCD